MYLSLQYLLQIEDNDIKERNHYAVTTIRLNYLKGLFQPKHFYDSAARSTQMFHLRSTPEFLGDRLNVQSLNVTCGPAKEDFC